MPNLAELFGRLVSLIGEQLGASSLRLGGAPTIAIFGVVLVLLSMLARPPSRWTTRDLGRLASMPRAMALAAEGGAGAVFNLGSAGVARATSALDRLQTLAALPILGHAARAAARSGIALRVVTNDAVARHLAQGVLADAHRRTETPERAARTTVEFSGEGRPAAAAAAMADPERPAAAFVAGGLAEDALLLMSGTTAGADWTSVGTATAAQATSVMLVGGGTLIGPELYQAPSDLGTAGRGRTGVLAANRLIVAALGVLALGSLLSLVGGVDLAAFLAGH
jgi:alpha-D-ribose 1-methylphosphonate 5-triphosphate synthase subunit PhnG